MNDRKTGSLVSDNPVDLIWEAKGIAAAIGRTPRQTHHLLAQGALPARRVGGRWVASRKALSAFFEKEGE